MYENCTIKIGTRTSRLARYQADLVKQKLEAFFAQTARTMSCEVIEIKTTGDRVTDRPLCDIGGKALFTKEIDQALLDGRIDIAVHSIKDIETHIHQDLFLQAVLEREDPRDTLIINSDLLSKTTDVGHTYGHRLALVPHQATLGTASLRRQSQLLHLRPDLNVVLLRGNVPTRLEKIASGTCDVTLLAAAGLKRLGLFSKQHDLFPADIITPAVGQGGIGLVCRQDDKAIQTILTAINHNPSYKAITLERLFLLGVNGDCHTPVGGLVEFLDSNQVQFHGCVATPDGRHLWREKLILKETEAALELKRMGQEMNKWLVKHKILPVSS